jgi:hypothetical protein
MIKRFLNRRVTVLLALVYFVGATTILLGTIWLTSIGSYSLRSIISDITLSAMLALAGATLLFRGKRRWVCLLGAGLLLVIGLLIRLLP